METRPLSTEDRIEWIDQAKGYAMLLVIFCHSPTIDFLAKAGYIFHVPFFFFLSGYVYNNTKYLDIRAFFRSRAISIGIPYLCFSAFGLLVMFLLISLEPGPLLSHSYKFGKAVAGTILGVRNTSRFHGTLWFLACLITVETMFTLINYYTRKKIILALAISFLLSLVGMLFVYKANYKHQVPFNVDAALVMISFFALGNAYRTINPLFSSKWIIWILGGTGLAMGLFNDRIDTFFLRFGNPILFYAASISCIIFLTFLFRQLRPIKAISRVGKSSLTLLALHQWYIFGPLNFLMEKFGMNPGSNILARFGLGVAFTVIAIAILVPLSEYLQAKLPFIVGKSQIHNKA